MRKIITLFVLLLANNSYSAKLNMNPGLWNINTTISSEGKKIDPMAELRKSLEKMPQAQREQMLEALGKQVTADMVTQICITEEMINNPENFKFDKNSTCTYKLKKQTSTTMEMSFQCKDGSQGDSTMTILSTKEFKMITQINGADKKKAILEYKGNIVGETCN